MTSSRDNDPEVGLLRMLRSALDAGLAPGADEEAMNAARSAAQIIGLPGLDAGLEALDERRGRPWPTEASDLVEFIGRLVAEHQLRAIRAADHEILPFAAALRVAQSEADSDREAAVPPGPRGRALEGGGASPGQVEATLPPAGAVIAAEALSELPLSGDRGTERASRAWLMPAVAASLRAALEWLSGDLERPRPFRLRAEDSVLEVVCEQVNPEGLAAAHEVLSASGGNLAPYAEVAARAVAGTWLVRVPAWSPRPVHLMFEQGELRLALPWHAVLRLSLVPSIEIEMRGGTLSTPVLEPLATLDPGLGERPVVAIAHGAKRALLVADRLVWRLGAEPCEPPGTPPVAGLTAAVRSDEGEVFWVADPGVLLGGVAAPGLPAPARRESPPAPMPPPPGSTPPASKIEAPLVLSAADVDPIALTAADVEPIERTLAPLALTPAEVAPLEVAIVASVTTAPVAPVEITAPVASAAPASAASRVLPDWLERFGATGGPGRSAPSSDSPSIPRPTAPGVLIAEDSIAARHFLARLFERRGLAVVAVENAAGLRSALAQRAWSLLCVDVELPDAAGVSMLDELRGALTDVPLVALVRDDEDAERAAGAGVQRWLRKPFDGDEVDHLLGRLGLVGDLRS